MPQERVTPAEQETEMRRIAQIEKEARDASFARRDAELAAERLGDGWFQNLPRRSGRSIPAGQPQVISGEQEFEVQVGWPAGGAPLTVDKSGALCTGVTPDGKLSALKVDADGYALTRLHPNDLGTLRSIVRIGRHRNRTGEDLDHVVALARELLLRYGVDE